MQCIICIVQNRRTMFHTVRCGATLYVHSTKSSYKKVIANVLFKIVVVSDKLCG